MVVIEAADAAGEDSAEGHDSDAAGSGDEWFGPGHVPLGVSPGGPIDGSVTAAKNTVVVGCVTTDYAMQVGRV